MDRGPEFGRSEYGNGDRSRKHCRCIVVQGGARNLGYVLCGLVMFTRMTNGGGDELYRVADAGIVLRQRRAIKASGGDPLVVLSRSRDAPQQEVGLGTQIANGLLCLIGRLPHGQVRPWIPGGLDLSEGFAPLAVGEPRGLPRRDMSITARIGNRNRDSLGIFWCHGPTPPNLLVATPIPPQNRGPTAVSTVSSKLVTQTSNVFGSAPWAAVNRGPKGREAAWRSRSAPVYRACKCTTTLLCRV
jgi:hypothetical protein